MNKKNAPEQYEHIYLNIDSLIEELDRLADEEVRITRRKVDDIFRAMRFQLPNAPQVITSVLASILLTDSPHASTDTTLNTVIICLGRILCNPAQTEPLSEAIQVYFHARKITEKEYAAEIAHAVLENHPATVFPEKARSGMEEMVITLMEKIINEKLSRKTPGYKPHSVLDLINPYLLYKLANPELERLKTTMPQVLKNWIATVGQEGYDKINNEKKFAQIMREKEISFGEFKKYLTAKSLNKASFLKNVDKIRDSQTDRNEKHNELAEELILFLTTKSIMGKSAPELEYRFHFKLRKLFNTIDQNPEIFRSEEAVLAAHEEAYKNILNDVNAIKKIITAITTIEKTYTKNFFNTIAGRKNLQALKDLTIDTLLGPETQRREMATGLMRTAREGGYPQKNLNELYSAIINQLQVMHDMLKGAFTTTLKEQIQLGINNLLLESSAIRIFPDSVSVITKPTLVPPLAPEPAQNKTAAAKPVPVEEAVIPAVAALGSAPVKPAPAVTPAAEAIKIKLVGQEETVVEKPVIEKPPAAKPVTAEAEPAIKSAPDEMPKFQSISKVVSENKFSTKKETAPTILPSLLKDEYKPGAEMESRAPLNVSFNNTPQAMPKVQSSPATPVVENPPLESELITPPPISQPVDVDAGAGIMKNYHLGELEKPVQDAWKKMTAAAKAAGNDAEDVALLIKDNEIQLYVICDLVQQVSTIDENKLTPEQKEILHSIKAVLLAALSNPQEENNWSCFEGIRRDDIDRAIATLQA